MTDQEVHYINKVLGQPPDPETEKGWMVKQHGQPYKSSFVQTDKDHCRELFIDRCYRGPNNEQFDEWGYEVVKATRTITEGWGDEKQ